MECALGWIEFFVVLEMGVVRTYGVCRIRYKMNFTQKFKTSAFMCYFNSIYWRVTVIVQMISISTSRSKIYSMDNLSKENHSPHNELSKAVFSQTIEKSQRNDRSHPNVYTYY